jgi:hypothetical protein
VSEFRAVLARARALVDPSVASVLASPREDRELFIAANNGHVLAFDNLTRPENYMNMRPLYQPPTMQNEAVA